jgi:FMN phosphatase YigB (HAD superfamily)
MADRIKLLITDLDNTLYDWLSSFVPAFYAMITVAAETLSVDPEQLLDEMKTVHQRHHNSEKPFALLETATVTSRYPQLTPLARKELLGEAFTEFNNVRRANLKLYPGVRETLKQIRKSGCLIVAHTDAVAENSMHRLVLLDLIEYIQCLYAPESKAPEHPDPQRPRIDEKYGELLYLLPSNHCKPNPAVLKDICARHGVSVSETLYVGDSLSRDIAMAKSAGAIAAWARYGARRDSELWQKLVRVTHWTDEDVAHERRLQEEARDIQPDVMIDSFRELLTSRRFDGVSQSQDSRALAASCQ